MRYFLQLTRARDDVVFLCNLDCVQRIIIADLGCLICWSNADEPTQVKESYDEIHGSIQTILGK